MNLANAIRSLGIDAIERAQSGHPGMVLGMADIATALWHQHLRHNPANPEWPNRDRFVQSNGHGSMLLYALLHLTGYDLSIDDLKAFRKLHSKTPGHPECDITPGVETTTGPLGQGLANAVGMALAEQILAAQFNQPQFNIVDHHTYCFVGDGCLMEGVSHEASSLAGTLGLGKLIVFWDDNGISIDGAVSGWCSDNVAMRFQSYNWQVIEGVDGHNVDAINAAIAQAQQDLTKPTLICCKTTIGFGSPKVAGSSAAHGAPLGTAEARITKEKLGCETLEPFVISDAVYNAWNNKASGAKLEQDWNDIFVTYKQQFPELAAELVRRTTKQLPINLFATLKNTDIEKLATRQSSQKIIEQLTAKLPELIGGSADLAGSNGTLTKLHKVISKADYSGNYINYGVREFAMSAIMNGLALHGEFIPYGGTFLTFADYSKNALRMAAIMQQRVIFLFSHDSIALGEDGPTHQPIEHINMLRLIPNMTVWRPADYMETAVAWHCAIQHTTGPSSILLTRQSLPNFTRTSVQLDNINKGAYVLYEPENHKANSLIIATGSEVHIAMQAAEILAAKHNCYARVISMPCMELFLQQDKQYQADVLPESISNRVVIEAGSRAIWYRFAQKIIGIDTFGASGTGSDVLNEYGFTANAVVELVLNED